MATSRYLTAQKISLLVLVNLYCDRALPSSATIPVLSFLLSKSICRVSAAARSRHNSEHGFSPASIQDFEDVLQGHASSMPGRTLLDHFSKHIWGINSFDALHDLFNNLSILLERPSEEEQQDSAGPERIYLSKTSPLGAFVRRARLEFTRLQFDDSLKLWAAFVEYRAPTAKWNKRLAGLAPSGSDVSIAQLGIRPGDAIFEAVYGNLSTEDVVLISVDDLDSILEFQLDQLQRLGTRVPDDMAVQLRNMLNPTGFVLRQIHLVKLFDAWKAGDYTSAFDCLHRYYDYAMQTREKTHYQYALLHMAILQADFGCFDEAIAAINETIATARENQDMTCLNFSLSWLNHMSKAYPKQMKGAGYMGMLASERDGLTFLKAKAKEAKMHHLLSATLLNEAKLCLATGEPISRALEYVYQSAYLNIRGNVNNYGRLMLFQSTLYSRLGITHLSTVLCDLLLHCYRHGCAVDEQVRAICRIAFGATQHGRYDEALQLLETVDRSIHRTVRQYQYILSCICLIKLRRAIRRTDWQGCTVLLQSLHPTSTRDPELVFLIREARISFLIARRQYPEAFVAIEELASSLREESADIHQRVTTLLLKAELFAKVGKPERGFSVAMRAASVSFKARLMPKLWDAVGRLGGIFNALGEFEAARRLLDAVIPQSLESADHTLTGMLSSQISDSYIGLAGLEDASTTQGARARASYISRAEMYIDRARDAYKTVEDIEGACEQLMKKAVLAKLRGDEKVAEEWAQNYNRMWEDNQERISEGRTVGGL
ncbi:anaphase-promoting complex subunit 5-domain-containing protein [Lophiotrema nucula]|uniref:Anaphase-promoting complex subunit 5 n=1 Tax=Lophiotrema nucula TaxID=690887 RepID=A0A6A5YI67_9PLEO|nr:anaphase-promoting complex subunit 5-domain-containing protein [Lophiotrema nucula]